MTEHIGLNVFDRKCYRIRVDEGVISAIEVLGNIKKKDVKTLICPGGLVDTQVNGYLGIDYSDPSLKAEDCDIICKELVKKGTFQHFATIVTRPQNVILDSIDKIIKRRKECRLVERAITGIHIEGPFISYEDGPRGAHELSYVRPASIAEFDQWYDHAQGLLKYITVGAESEGVCKLIRHAVAKGVVVSIGHTGATRDQIDKAVEAGASVSTHLGNGVFAKLDRFENPIWPQLRNEKLTTGIICDGHHVVPDLVWVYSKCKDTDHIIIVTDLSQVAGLPPGKMMWGTLPVEIMEDGIVVLCNTPNLAFAGAGSLLLQNTWNYASFSKTDYIDAFKLSATNPIRKYNLDLERAKLEVGKSAEFFSFTRTDKGYDIDTVYYDGIRLV